MNHNYQHAKQGEVAHDEVEYCDRAHFSAPEELGFIAEREEVFIVKNHFPE